MANQAAVVHWLDNLIVELELWRDDMAKSDREAVNRRFEQAIDLRAQWLRMRERGEWEEAARPEDMPSFWRRLFGLSGSRISESRERNPKPNPTADTAPNKACTAISASRRSGAQANRERARKDSRG